MPIPYEFRVDAETYDSYDCGVILYDMRVSSWTRGMMWTLRFQSTHVSVLQIILPLDFAWYFSPWFRPMPLVPTCFILIRQGGSPGNSIFTSMEYSWWVEKPVSPVIITPSCSGGLEHVLLFHSVGNYDPNWRAHSFQRGRPPQPPTRYVVNPTKASFSYGFPMVFLWFSYGYFLLFDSKTWIPALPLRWGTSSPLQDALGGPEACSSWYQNFTSPWEKIMFCEKAWVYQCWASLK